MRTHIAHIAMAIAMRGPGQASLTRAALARPPRMLLRGHLSQLPHFLLPAAWLADSNWVWTLPACACVTHDRESFKNTPRGGHADAPARTAEEAAQEMREGKGGGILGGSGVA